MDQEIRQAQSEGLQAPQTVFDHEGRGQQGAVVEIRSFHPHLFTEIAIFEGVQKGVFFGKKKALLNVKIVVPNQILAEGFPIEPEENDGEDNDKNEVLLFRRNSGFFHLWFRFWRAGLFYQAG